MTPTGARARRADERWPKRARGFCAWLLLLAAVLTSYACQAPALAKLEKKSGSVERDYSDKQRAWEAANVGTEFRVGDAVQTLAESSAILGLDDGAQLALEANTLIRFSATPPKERGLAFDLEIGSAAFSTTGIALSLGTPTEFARLEAGSRVVLSRGPGGLRFVVQVGRAVLDDVRLEVGQAVMIDAAGTSTPVAAMAPAPEATSAPGAKPAGDVKAVVRGQNASVYADGSWRALPQGATQLGQGTELKLERNTQVELTRGDQAATLNQNGRYVVAPRADILVVASAGSLSAGSEGPVRVEVPGGVIVVAPLGKVNVELHGKGVAQLSVEAREAVLETARGTETVRAGEQASLSADGRVDIEGRSLDYADLELQAGESVAIHDPSPPTAVRFLFGDLCPEVGILQLQGSAQSFAAGRGAVALAMKAGTYRYELRCKSDAPSATRRGRITI
ncbi:MAG TPA: hypothetical protein VNN80_09775, partial [Polyangiaceae bacterium]|nr:hypothetical protein [Polyangiaceae bacterium]